MSRTLHLKILKTKKRLSSDRWPKVCGPIALFVVFAIAFVGYRLTSLPMVYSIVRGDIPVVPISLEDPTLHHFLEAPKSSLTDNTPTVVIDDAGNLFFGKMSAFSTEFENVRNKYVIKSKDGSPQTAALLRAMKEWIDSGRSPKSPQNDGVTILIPSSRVPMTVVIKVMSELRYSDVFEKVILGYGLM